MTDTKAKTVQSPLPEQATGQAPADAKPQVGAGAALTVQDLTV